MFHTHIQGALIHQVIVTLRGCFIYYYTEEMQYFLLTGYPLDMLNNMLVNHVMNQNTHMELIFSKIAQLLSSQIQINHLLS